MKVKSLNFIPLKALVSENLTPSFPLNFDRRDIILTKVHYSVRRKRRKYFSNRDESTTAATSKMTVNYYLKALYLGCCSSPRSASA